MQCKTKWRPNEWLFQSLWTIFLVTKMSLIGSTLSPRDQIEQSKVVAAIVVVENVVNNIGEDWMEPLTWLLYSLLELLFSGLYWDINNLGGRVVENFSQNIQCPNLELSKYNQSYNYSIFWVNISFTPPQIGSFKSNQVH